VFECEGDGVLEGRELGVSVLSVFSVVSIGVLR